MSHTPGPWHIHWGDKYPYIRAANGDYVLDHNSRAYVRHPEDANLIAESPELLRCCVRALGVLIECADTLGEASRKYFSDEAKVLAATISKATGGKP